MPSADLVLLHAPSVYDFRKRANMPGPVSDLVPSTPAFEMYPLGFTTMAEYMERNGLRVRIVNLAGRMLYRKNFDVEAAIRDMNPVAFGIDLHWMPHAHGSVEVAKIIKKYHPNTPVIFGGLTASYFHEELVSYPWIDYVVRGDSTEEPMTQLMYALKRGGSIADIPNLTWSAPDGSINVNPFSWVPDTMNDISLDYSYSMRSVIRDRDMMSAVPFRAWLQYPVVASLTCRGCTHNCVTCGGSAYAFKNHFGRDRIALRDPELLVRDIERVQRYIPGPIFVLNDFVQGGMDHAEAFIRGLSRIKFRNPIGFELFKPPTEEFYQLLNENLSDYSIEISAESFDDVERTAFGKGHFTTEDLEKSIEAGLRNGCKRFDLYFMTGIPTQTPESALATVDYIESLYDRVDNDKRLLAFSSPMAPFLDPGSLVFDHPERFGYELRARTLEEHRQLLLEPSWQHIMNYESGTMSRQQMVDTTYEIGLRLNALKTRIGHVDPTVSATTEKRILDARSAMASINQVMQESTGAERVARLTDLRGEFTSLSESTINEKAELNWPASTNWRHVANIIGLWAKENALMLLGVPYGVVRAEPPVVVGSEE